MSNVSRVRPKGNKFKNLPPELVAQEIKHLKEDIEKVRPNVICVMGNEPLEALQGHRGITNWRGSVLYNEEFHCKVIPTIHPAAILRNWDYHPLVRADLCKVLKESVTPKLNRKERLVDVLISEEEIKRYLEGLGAEKGMVSFDIETTREEVHMTSMAFATSPERATVIPFTINTHDPYWDTPTHYRILQYINKFMKNGGVKKVAQNGTFDMGVLQWRYGIRTKGLVLDTMCAFHTLNPELRKSLNIQRSLYTDQPYYDHLAKQGDGAFWRYNGLDAMVTFEVAERELEELEEMNLRSFYYKHVHPLIDILMQMQLKGVKINTALREEMVEEHTAKLALWEMKLDDLVGYEVNALSPKQLGVLLYEEMGLPTQRIRGTRKVTTNVEAIAFLSKKFPSPEFEAILSIRSHTKTLGTYLKVPLKEGRIHTSYNIGGSVKIKDKAGTIQIKSAPETGRLSSSESIIVGSGTNLQNQPKSVRKLFLPDPGYKLVEADLSQAEARVVAYLTQDERLLEIFKSGKDIHTLNASRIFKKPYEEVTEEERFFGKKHCHALNYKEGPKTFAAMTGLPYGEAVIIRNSFYDAAPRIQKWHMEVESHVDKFRRMETPFGRKRQFHGRRGDDRVRKAIAYVPQSTVADLLNLALIQLDKEIKECHLDWHLLLQVHDSMVFQVPYKTLIEHITLVLDRCFNIPIKIHNRTLLIPYDVKVGMDWGHMEEVE